MIDAEESEARRVRALAYIEDRERRTGTAIVRAALVWSYTNDDTDEGRTAKNALLLAIEEYEDDHPDATHDAIVASEALGQLRTDGARRVHPSHLPTFVGLNRDKGCTCSDSHWANTADSIDDHAAACPLAVSPNAGPALDPYGECRHCGTWHYTRNQRKCSNAQGHAFGAEPRLSADSTKETK
jgi:hypothetical protein